MSVLVLDADPTVSASFFADKHLAPQARVCIALAVKRPSQWRQLHAYAWCLNAEHFRRAGRDVQEVNDFLRPKNAGTDPATVEVPGYKGTESVIDNRLVELCRQCYRTLVGGQDLAWSTRSPPWWWDLVPVRMS